MDVEKISVDGFNLNVSDAKARDMISDKYDPDNGTYVVGDTCINDDVLYTCNTDIDTPEDFDSTKWDADTVGHYCSELKSNLTQLAKVTDSGVSTGSGIRTVLFNKTFTTIPNVVVTPTAPSDGSGTSYVRGCTIREITTTYFKFVETAISSNTVVQGTDDCYWIAIEN